MYVRVPICFTVRDATRDEFERRGKSSHDPLFQASTHCMVVQGWGGV